MKCDFCAKKSTVFLTQLVDGQMKKVCLCDECAKERGVTDPTGFSLADLLAGGLGAMAEAATVTAKPPVVRAGNGKQCATCDFTIEDLKRVRRLGCADCYTTFHDEVSQMIRGMHKGTSHSGKVPEGLIAMQFKSQRLEELRTKLEQAISSESYEEAADIRDLIRNLDTAAAK
ncbi:MAG: excinuclease ABC subunit B [Akkermansiaceae bacterium]|nr:excinuclease ABC subunit B [Akkermansiaceae bacterium]